MTHLGVDDRIDTIDDAASLAPTVAEIDLGSIRHNVRLLQERAGDAALMGVVKGNAYGHGAVRIVHVLREEGVRHFAVATVPEGIQLREAGVVDPILVLGAPLSHTLPAFHQHHLDVNVTSAVVAEAVARVAREQGALRVHVKIDTGMHRLGIAPAEAGTMIRMLEQAPGVHVAALWTHFAAADEPDPAFAYEQLRRFAPVLAALRDAAPLVHVANSAALLRLGDDLGLDQRTLVRTGIALYGYSALAGLAPSAGLEPAMRLTTRVTHVQTVATGETVSYGRRWKAERPTRVATLSAGYADGYPRLLSNTAEVNIGGARYPLIGTICMDMSMVNLGDPGGPGALVQPGDEAVLFGEGGPSVDEVARWAGTIPYEICSSITARVPRRYVE